MTPRVLLRPKRAEPFYNRHPWVFAGAVDRVEGEPADGTWVRVESSAGNFVAWGLFNSQSKIRVRLYEWSEDLPSDLELLRDRLVNALALRRDLLRLTDDPEGGYRLVNSEADGLSGLTVDVYARWAAVQFTSLGLGLRRDLVAECLNELIALRGVYVRTERGIGKLEGLELRDGPLAGGPPPQDLGIVEHGVRFRLNLREGQKTGFFLDQRDNRRAVGTYAAGRRCLDCFCYSGGFALNMARAGAESVVGVDGSEPALELARGNASANGLSNAEFVKADVFDDLAARVARRERYGVVVLDPPKFARSRQAVPEALRGYRRLLTLAAQVLEPGGVLVMCCCSGLIEAAMVEQVLAQVGVAESKPLQVLERRGAAPDHPVALCCPESAYLKCFVTRAG